MQLKNTKLSDETRGLIKSGLMISGYSDDMFSDDVGFIGQNGHPYKSDMVAYSGWLRKDTESAVIGVKGTKHIDDIQYSDIEAFGALSTPLIIFSENKKITGKIARKIT